MEKPTLEQFGLTQMDFLEVKKRADGIRKIGRRISFVCIFIAIIFSTVYLIQNLQFDIFGFLFVVCFIGVAGGIIVGRVAAWLLDTVMPRHPKQDKVEQYEKSVKRYDKGGLG